jgi:dicarboxylate transporter 10
MLQIFKVEDLGVTATTVCSPVDVIKTRIINSTGEKSVWLTLRQPTLTEGPVFMLKCWLHSFIRLGPHTVLSILILEQHKRVYTRLTS